MIEIRDNVYVARMSAEQLTRIDFAKCAEPKETMESWYKRQSVKPTIVINGGLFHMDSGEPILTYCDDGVFSSKSSYLPGMAICGDMDLRLTDFQGTFRDFITGYPVLMRDGERQHITYALDINYAATRTVLAIGKDGSTLAICIDRKVKFAEMQDILQDLGVWDAINLDGGGSMRMLYNGEKVCGSLWSRPVDNVIAFYCKPLALYRVQLGAFVFQSGADRYLAKIQQIPTYADVNFKKAYRRKVGLMHKVQVGAFEKREGAELIEDYVESLGYGAFIDDK